MSQETIVPNPGTADKVATVHPIPGSYRIKFYAHNFEAFCYSTRNCSVVYDNHEHTRLSENVVTPPPSGKNYRDAWGLATYIVADSVLGPAVVHWTSMDGVQHEAKVDMSSIFKDHWALNNVPENDSSEASYGVNGPETTANIFLEVNDRTISVYIKTEIDTKTEQKPGNKYSYFRDDLILVWTHTY